MIVYPSRPLNWDAASVALTRDGNVVLAVGPDQDRGLDMDAHVRDFRAAFQLWLQEQLPPLEAPDGDWALMSGSFGSLILFRALPDLPVVPPVIVDVGGVSDAFLGVQALYGEELRIPAPYDSAIAALGRPDRDPAFFFDYSPVFYAGHLPPMFIIHTTNDEVIPYNQAEVMAEAMAEAGTPHELLLYTDTTHYLDAYNPTPGTELVYEKVLNYVNNRRSP
jgi:acetyl esterase/lipase